MIPIGKVCSKCKSWKPFEQFYRATAKCLGLKSECKECFRVIQQTWESRRTPEQKEQQAQQARQRTKAWQANNKDRDRDGRRKRRAAMPQVRLASALRIRLCKVLRGRARPGSFVRDLGCTPAELVVYLESKFADGMSWDGRGLKGLHIDHIRPLCSFDLTDREQFLQACHYTNLQPLWAADNLRKSGTHLPQQIKAEERCGTVPVVAI